MQTLKLIFWALKKILPLTYRFKAREIFQATNDILTETLEKYLMISYGSFIGFTTTYSFPT